MYMRSGIQIKRVFEDLFENLENKRIEIDEECVTWDNSRVKVSIYSVPMGPFEVAVYFMTDGRWEPVLAKCGGGEQIEAIIKSVIWK